MKTVQCTSFGAYPNLHNGKSFLGLYLLRERLGKRNLTIRAQHVTLVRGDEAIVSLDNYSSLNERKFILKIVKGGAR